MVSPECSPLPDTTNSNDNKLQKDEGEEEIVPTSSDNISPVTVLQKGKSTLYSPFDQNSNNSNEESKEEENLKGNVSTSQHSVSPLPKKKVLSELKAKQRLQAFLANKQISPPKKLKELDYKNKVSQKKLFKKSEYLYKYFFLFIYTMNVFATC